MTLRDERSSWERSGVILDVSLAGAGIETEEPLIPGERLTVAIATPTLWDPLVLTAIVAWAHPARIKNELDALGRPKLRARSGVAFDYPTPDAALAMFETLSAMGYE